MGDETIRKVLKNFGLTEKETEVYIFLAKHGVLRSGEIAKGIKTHRAEIYRMLKSLQAKGLVEATLESPTRFTTVPFETVLDSFIKAKREETALIELAKQDLLSDWRNISKIGPEPALEKFVVIEGNRKIYPKIAQMIRETKRQLSTISTVSGLVRADQFGLFDAAFDNPLKSQIQFRFLTELSDQNLNAVKTLLKRTAKTGFNFKGRNPNLGLQLSPRMVIRDEEEILFFITPKTDVHATGQDDVCLWTNCKALVQSFIAVFEDLWRNSTDIETKIIEIETGKPTPKTYVISDAETAHKKYHEAMHSAKEEIVMMTSSKGLVACWKGRSLVREWTKRGVSVRIMAPITSENLEAAQQLLKCCEVRHVPVGYLGTTIVDGQHLFQFKNPPPEEEELRSIPYFENTFYTNDFEYVEKTKNMLNDIWKNARTPSAVTLESVISPPKPMANSLSDSTILGTIKKINGPILIEGKKPSAELTEKDIMNKVINAQKHPTPASSKGIVRQYGSTGQAIIRPPEHFNLPDTLIHILHFEKHSTHGVEDAMIICLWLETPKGYAYVPTAFVGDNPEAMDFWKKVFARIPFEQNIQLVRKDELQVRVHGNTLFAGWTVPISLLHPPYNLPPSAILLEGYGKVKTSTYGVDHPSGYKVIHEYNGFEAFVTFFHPSSKYAGPGTDGFFGRDNVSTMYPP